MSHECNNESFRGHCQFHRGVRRGERLCPVCRSRKPFLALWFTGFSSYPFNFFCITLVLFPSSLSSFIFFSPTYCYLWYIYIFILPSAFLSFPFSHSFSAPFAVAIVWLHLTGLPSLWLSFCFSLPRLALLAFAFNRCTLASVSFSHSLSLSFSLGFFVRVWQMTNGQFVLLISTLLKTSWTCWDVGWSGRFVLEMISHGLKLLRQECERLNQAVINRLIESMSSKI